MREAEADLVKGQTIADVCKQVAVTDQACHRWHKEYGPLRMDQARRLKDRERENSRLHTVIADLTLDNAILKAEGD